MKHFDKLCIYTIVRAILFDKDFSGISIKIQDFSCRSAVCTLHVISCHSVSSNLILFLIILCKSGETYGT